MKNTLNNTTTSINSYITPTIFHIWGIFAAALVGGVLVFGANHSLVFAGMTLAHSLFSTIVPTVTILFAVGVTYLKNSVHNLLCLIAVFFNTVLLFLYAGSEFLAFLFLIVYVGAIAILFLFVIMLLHLKMTYAKFIAIALTSVATSLFIAASLSMIVGIENNVANAVTAFTAVRDVFISSLDSATIDSLVHYITHRHADILAFSERLYTIDSFLFYLASLLLLTAMLGAIVLAAGATDLKELQLTQIVYRAWNACRTLFLKASSSSTVAIAVSTIAWIYVGYLIMAPFISSFSTPVVDAAKAEAIGLVIELSAARFDALVLDTHCAIADYWESGTTSIRVHECTEHFKWCLNNLSPDQLEKLHAVLLNKYEQMLPQPWSNEEIEAFAKKAIRKYGFPMFIMWIAPHGTAFLEAMTFTIF